MWVQDLIDAENQTRTLSQLREVIRDHNDQKKTGEAIHNHDAVFHSIVIMMRPTTVNLKNRRSRNHVSPGLHDAEHQRTDFETDQNDQG